jgi:RNA polymerase sigma factor for flagellar operon FliA
MIAFIANDNDDQSFDAAESSPESGTMKIAIPVSAADMAPYMNLVGQVVARVLRRLPRNVLREDLVAAGTYGLMDALRKSKGERDERFECYARIRIHGAVIDELRNQDWLARSARADVTAQAKADDRSSSTTIVGIDDLPEGQRGVTAIGESPFDLAERRSQRDALAKAVQSLPEREANIVDLHYFQGVQFKEIAAQLKVSEARVSQLHTRALGMLRPLLASEENAA